MVEVVRRCWHVGWAADVHVRRQQPRFGPWASSKTRQGKAGKTKLKEGARRVSYQSKGWMDADERMKEGTVAVEGTTNR